MRIFLLPRRRRRPRLTSLFAILLSLSSVTGTKSEAFSANDQPARPPGQQSAANVYMTRNGASLPRFVHVG